MPKEPTRVDEPVYRDAKSTRPSWANALIVAGVIFVAWLLVTVIGGFTVASTVLLIAAVVSAVISGIMALTAVPKRG